MKPTLLVLAAGSGSRYGGLKQFDAVGPNGETMMDYSVYDAIQAGFGKVVFVVRESFADQFESQVGSKYAGSVDIAYVCQELESYVPEGITWPKERHKPWGTGHAVLVAEHEIHESFMMVNADDFYGRESFEKMAEFLRTHSQYGLVDEYAMVGFLLKNTVSIHGTVSRGICETDEHNYLTSVVEFPKIMLKDKKIVYIDDLDEEYSLTGEEMTSMNMWGFSPTIFGHLRHQFLEFLHGRALEADAEFYIPTVVNNIMAAGEAKVKVLATNAGWFGMTYRQDLSVVHSQIVRLISQGKYPEKLW